MRRKIGKKKNSQSTGKTSSFFKDGENIPTVIVDIPVFDSDPEYIGHSYEVISPNTWFNQTDGILRFRNSAGDTFILEQGAAPTGEVPPTGETPLVPEGYLNLIEIVTGSTVCTSEFLVEGSSCENVWDSDLETETAFTHSGFEVSDEIYCEYDFDEPVRVDRIRVFNSQNSFSNIWYLQVWNPYAGGGGDWNYLLADGIDNWFTGSPDEWVEFDVTPEDLALSPILYSKYRIMSNLYEDSTGSISEIQLLIRDIQYSETNIMAPSYGTLSALDPGPNLSNIYDSDHETCGIANFEWNYAGPAYFQFEFEEPRRVGKVVLHGLTIWGEWDDPPVANGYFSLQAYDADLSEWIILVGRIAASMTECQKIELYSETYYSRFRLVCEDTWVRIICSTWEMYEIVE